MSLCLSTELCLLCRLLAPRVASPPPQLSQTSLYSSVKWAQAGLYTADPLPTAFQSLRLCPTAPDVGTVPLLAVETQA